MHEIRVNIQSQFQDLFSATGSLYTLWPIAQNICRVVASNQAHGHGISLPTRFHKYRSGDVCVLSAVVHCPLEATHQVFSRATAVPSRCHLALCICRIQLWQRPCFRFLSKSEWQFESKIQRLANTKHQTHLVWKTSTNCLHETNQTPDIIS